MSHIRMRHVPPVNESCPTYERVMSHIWMSHVSHINESCLHSPFLQTAAGIIGRKDAFPSWMSHVPHMHGSCPTNECVMSHTWMSRAPDMNTSCLHSVFLRAAAGVIGWIASFRSRMSHVPRVDESCLIPEWDISHTWMSHVYTAPSFGLPRLSSGEKPAFCHSRTVEPVQVNESSHTYESCHTHMVNESCHTYSERTPFRYSRIE